MKTASTPLSFYKTLQFKLISAFSAVLLTLAAIGLISYFALKTASDGFKSYRELARDSNLAGILQSNMLMVRMNVKDFLLTGSDKDIKEYDQYFNEVESLLLDAKKEINKPERAKMVQELNEEIHTYNTTFDIIKAYRVERDYLVNEKLNLLGPQMERELTDLMLDAANANNTQMGYVAGLAMRNLLLGRLYVVKYLESNDESANERVREEFVLFDTNMQKLNEIAPTFSSKQAIEHVIELRQEYINDFNQVHDLIVDRNDKVKNTLDVIGPTFAKLVNELRYSVKTDQDILGPQLKADNELAVSKILSFFAAALVLSIVIVFTLTRVVMKQLGKDPNELGSIALAIARGELDEEYDESQPKGVFKSMLTMRESLRESREKERLERKVAQVNARIKNALDNASSSVMIADKNNQIIYLNDAIQAMFAKVKQDLLSINPQFDESHIINSDLTELFPYFKSIENTLNTLTHAFKDRTVIANHTFDLVATPVMVEGKRVGTVLEWEDKTEWLAAEEEKARVASENARVKYALDGSSGRVMIVDKNYNVIYLNNAVSEMFQDAQLDIQGEIPHFNPNALKGNSVDHYFSHFTQQLEHFDTLKSSLSDQMIIGGRTFDIVISPVFVDLERVGTVIEWEDKTEWLAQEREKARVASENARVKYALDSVSGNVMIADPNMKLIYANNALRTTLSDSQQDMKLKVAGFDIHQLEGLPVEEFYEEPMQQRVVFNNLQQTHKSTENIGMSTFVLTANPIIVDGERIGTVVEWTDRTAELNIEQEIDEIVHAAATGDLSKKVSLEGKDGFFGKLSQGLNNLVSTVEVAMDDVMVMLDALAQGDLTKRITNEYQGAFGKLKEDTNTTAEKLTETIGSIRSSASIISQSANEIAQGNADLSQRTEEQASSLEETAASMDEITTIVQQSAERAENANTVSREAEDKAEEGGKVVSLAVSAMKEINDSSKEISEIIGVIDEIAFQTNLLALNAAVEAARAGEQGRGFAVVAGEVRNLAQRSSEAAKEIKELIRDSQMKVEEGTELVNRSGDTLREIVDTTSQVRIMMQDIAESARQQSDGIMQINQAITQMDEMTQQNAALVEQASAAGESMAEQANSMNGTMNFFSISNMGHALSTSTIYEGEPQQQSAQTYRAM